MKYYLILCVAIALSSCSEKHSEPHSDRNSNKSVFRLLSSSQTNIDFTNTVKETEENNYFTNQYIYNGGGVAVGDLNNDGLDDIYFTGNEVDDKLYINKGNLQFEDITLTSGIKTGDNSWSTGVCFIDLNADGWLDIYVCKAGHNQSIENRKNQLYINRQDGTFLLDTENKLSDAGLSTQASFFDYDLDGDLDAYILNYPEKFDLNLASNKNNSEVNETDSDKFYRNDGNGHFTDITAASGLNNYAFGLGVITADFTGDHYPDIYVANDYMENDFLYENMKNGTFKEKVKFHTGHNSQSSMGIDRADINNDGYEDFFVAEMLPSDYKRSKENMASMDVESFWYFISQGHHYQYMHNVLQVDNQNSYYSDLSQMAGVDKTDWSWSPVLEDLDNDGHVDLFVTNGILKDVLDKDAKNRRKYLEKKGQELSLDELYNSIESTKLSNYLYRNKGDYEFEDVSSKWGVDQPSFSNGATATDLDNDGDLDLIVNNLKDQAFIYENTSSTNGNDYVFVQLEWPKSPNPTGVNSKIELYSNGEVLSREILPTAGFQSGRSTSAHFGLGKNRTIDSAKVIWPIGTIQNFEVTAVNTTVTVTYNPTRTVQPRQHKKYFKEINPSELGLTFTHKENKFNDFEKEILLPHRQSTLGPALEVGDINGDGLEDVFVGGASGQKSELFLQSSDGTFTLVDTGDKKEWESVAAKIFDADKDGDGDLYLVNGGGQEQIDKRDMYYVNQGTSGMIPYPRGRPGMKWQNGSCIASADFDGNGFVDVFVGARATPNFYPLSDSSYLTLNENGRFKSPEKSWFSDLPEAGAITSAVATDFNQDGKPDLVIAGEWMPVMFYENTGSSFKNVTADFGLENDIGWWYSLATADLNNDGIEDIIAGNVGLNHKFRPTKEQPFTIYYDDYDQNGQGDIILTSTSESGESLPIRGKQCMSEQMPFISEQHAKTYNEFANSDLNQLLGANANDSKVKLQANQFASSIFYSSKTGFTRTDMHKEAQKSAINAIEILDVNSDGELDLILTGNMYNTEVETTRLDASIGCVLLSAKTPAFNSGLIAPGNVKQSKMLTTANGTYLLVANNNANLQVFKWLN